MSGFPINDSEIIFTAIITALVLFLLVASIGVFILFYQKKRKDYITEIEYVKSQFEQTLLAAKLEIREQTLQHVGYELHDNLGQVASLIKINLHTLDLSDTEKVKQKIEDTKELVRLLIGDLKSLSLSMNPDRIVQLGIVAAAENEIARLNKIGTFEGVLLVEGPSPPIDANTTIIVYRMLQEMLNNSIKHSNSRIIKIELKVTENFFTLVCSDEGVGFDLKDVLGQNGSGLINLQNRAKLINGNLTIKSSSAGTVVSIKLPL